MKDIREALFLYQIAVNWLEQNETVLDGSINIDKLYELALRHRMFRLAHTQLESAIKKQYSNRYARYTAYSYLEKRQIKNHLEVIGEICGLLDANGIEYMIIKGLPQAYYVYDDIYCRDLGDIDLVVKENQVDKAYSLLRKIRFTQKDSKDAHLFLSSVYTWEVALVRDNVCLELKWGSSAVRKNFDALFEHTTYLSCENVKIRTLTALGTFVHMLINTHCNNEGREVCKNIYLRDYLECMIMLRKYKMVERWDSVYELLIKTESLHKAHEVFLSMNDLFDLDENEMKMVAFSRIDNCLYKHEIEGWSGKSNRCNAALLYDAHKPNVLARLFDTDYTISLFNKNLKNALYNKRGYDAQNVFIEAGSITQIPYHTLSGIKTEIQQTEAKLNIRIVFDKQMYSFEQMQKYIIEFQWYEKDSNIVPLFSGVEVDLAAICEGKESYRCEIKSDGYYTTEEYRGECEEVARKYNEAGDVLTTLSQNERDIVVSIMITSSVLPIDMLSPVLVCDLALREKKDIRTMSHGILTLLLYFSMQLFETDEHYRPPFVERQSNTVLEN